MTAAATRYATAGLRYLGQREDVKDGRWTNKQPFGVRFGWNAVPWCMIFAWCVADDVQASTLIPRTASCRTAAAWFRKRGQWHSRTSRPQVGDLVFFGRPRAPHHVGIVTHVDQASLTYVSGNSNDGRAPAGTGDAVTLKPVAIGSKTIAGYGRPAWPTAPPPEVKPSPSNDLGKIEPQDQKSRGARTLVIGRKGATLTAVAAALGISLSLLLSANPSADHLDPGAKVRLPAPGQATPPPASTPPAGPPQTGRGPFTLRCAPGKRPGVWRCTKGES